MHRLSMNPLRHIDWFGLFMMFAAGFGWAKPVPVDPRYFKKPKQGMALTALAGPMSNLLLAVLALMAARLVYYYMPYGAWTSPAINFCMETSVLSVGLGLFNLLPVPPLDGSKVLAVLLPDRAYMTLMRYERYGIFLLLLLSFWNVGGNLIGHAVFTVWSVLYSLVFV